MSIIGEISSVALPLLVPIVIGLIFTLVKRKKWIDSSLVEALEAGVNHAWNSYGQKRKVELNFESGQNPKGGKFTSEDKEKLRSIAKNTAKEVLKTQGLDLSKLVASEALQDLKIKKLVDRFKQA